MTSADYTVDLMPLTNTSAQAKSLLYSLELAAGGISFYLNADKTEFLHFKLEGDKTVKLINQFSYLGSIIFFTESDLNIHIEKAWTAVDRLPVV